MSTPTQTQTVEVCELRKTYRMGTQDVHALCGVSFTVPSGAFWAIMGPSGSGKSTVLNLLGCLDRPTSGRYFLDGRDVSTLSDDELSMIRLSQIGFIFQSFNLIPQLTVEENISLPLYYLGWEHGASTDRARELANRVGLGDRLEHRPTELSGGQRQRVAVARALANDPVLLLADEPTGNLDSHTGEEIMWLLHELNEQGKTIIMVTHEQEVATNARSCLVMRDGLIESLSGEGFGA